MKYYEYVDYANEKAGFIFHELKKLIIYISWYWGADVRLGEFDRIETFRPGDEDEYLTFSDMEEEIEDGVTDYGKIIEISKERLIKGIFLHSMASLEI